LGGFDVDLEIKSNNIITFDNGKVFPHNVIFMAYILGLVSIFAFLSNWLLGLILFLVSSFILTTKMKVEIDLNKSTYREYTHFFQIFKTGKTYDLNLYKFISVLPKRQSTVMYSRSSNSNIQTDFFHVICILNEKFKNKKEVSKFESKEKAILLAKELAEKMKLEFIEYDPKKVRELYLKDR
jgi:hypothetical protein